MSASFRKMKIGIVGFPLLRSFWTYLMGHVENGLHRALLEYGGDFHQEDNDVIIICTSILSFSGVIGSMSLHLLRLPVLLVDVLLVKEHPREILLQVLPEGADILCTHPTFGPERGKYGWKDLKFVYERFQIRDKETCSSFLQIFEIERFVYQGCRMLEMSCTNHDSLAGKSQFITHFIGRTLSKMEIESTPIDTKGFESLFQLLKNLELALEKVKQKLQRTDGNRKNSVWIII